jgi:hypothetical protein
MYVHRSRNSCQQLRKLHPYTSFVGSQVCSTHKRRIIWAEDSLTKRSVFSCMLSFSFSKPCNLPAYSSSDIVF